MRFLVVGSGGREHALVWKLAQESTVFATPGNAGIAQTCQTFNVLPSDTPGLIELAKAQQIDVVVVGPEEPGCPWRHRAIGSARDPGIGH